MWQRIIFNFKIGSEAINGNRFRTILTSLGMIFGVAAVIVLMAMGKGTEKEILDQIKLVGSNNIIIKPKTKNDKDQKPDDTQKKESKQWSPGLTLNDAENFKSSLQEIEMISPEVELSTTLMQNGISKQGKVIGVSSAYFDIGNMRCEQGRFFNENQIKNALPVCVIGKDIKTRYFAGKEVLGERIKCGDEWFTIIGVLQEREYDDKNAEKLALRNTNQIVFVPITTYLMHYGNREQAQNQNGEDEDGNFYFGQTDDGNKGQLDRIVVKIKESSMMNSITAVLEKILKRRHHEVDDYEIVVPELLLKQEQKTKERFNFLILIIGGISLIVGGIGIMNIMLASVTERTKEIGIRQAMGATKKDVVLQFLSEAVTISVIGGVIGILLGFTVCFSIEKLADVKTIITAWSVFISFFISVIVGVFSGYYPAKKASAFDVVVSLRYE